MNNSKINYYKQSLKTIDELSVIGKRPKLLLHACCGPCSTFPLTFLCKNFDVTIFFNNSNIFPETEYTRRLEELKRFLGYFERDFGYKVGLITVPYDNEKYNEDLQPYADLPEGQKRCFICYEKRMNQAFEYADKNRFDYFTTVMTISRQKNSQILNQIGEKLQAKYVHTKYFFSDFKKNKGIDIARDMRIHYNLYQQQYCGCKYSYQKITNNQKSEIDWDQVDKESRRCLEICIEMDKLDDNKQ